MNPGFAKTFDAGAAVAARRIVKFDGSGDVVQVAADTDACIGVSDRAGDIPSGGRIDVIMSGQPELEASGAIAFGAAVSAAADGRAKAAAAGDVCIGFAVTDAAAAGDIIVVNICRHTI